MLTLNFDPFPVLFSERLCLREITPLDAHEIFVQRSHPGIQKFIRRPPAKTLEDAFEFIKKITTHKTNRESINWAITLKGDDKLIGAVCLWNIEKENDKAELGYSLHPDYFRKGIMSETLSQVLDYGFRTMKLKVIDAYTNKENIASLKLLKKHGFKRNIAFEKEHVSKEELEYNVVYVYGIYGAKCQR